MSVYKGILVDINTDGNTPIETFNYHPSCLKNHGRFFADFTFLWQNKML